MAAKKGHPSIMEKCICGLEWICHPTPAEAKEGARAFNGCDGFMRPGRKFPKWVEEQELRAKRRQEIKGLRAKIRIVRG